MRCAWPVRRMAGAFLLCAAACGEEPESSDAGLVDPGAPDLDAGTGGADASDPGDAASSPDAGIAIGPGSWAALAPMPGGARQETSVVALADEIYVLGGFDESAQVLDRVEAYRPSTDSWRARAPLPFALHHMNAAVVGDRIYVVGGLTGLGFVQNPNVLRYDPGADRWDGLGEMPTGTDRGSSGVCAIGSTIYLAGGYRGGAALRMFSAYDVEAGTHTGLPDLPGPLDHLVAACAGGRIYVVGGRNRSIDAMTAEVWAFDPSLGAWSARSPLPRPRGGFAGAGVLNGLVYVFGGEGNRDPGLQGVFPDGDAYDPTLDRWFTVSAMRTPRHGTGAAALGGTLYVPGGATRQAFGAVDTHEAFSPQ